MTAPIDGLTPSAVDTTAPTAPAAPHPMGRMVASHHEAQDAEAQDALDVAARQEALHRSALRPPR